MPHADTIKKMFSSIADRYVLTNHICSGGMDWYWRSQTAKKIVNWNPSFALDIATGSGDLVLAMKKQVPNMKIVGLDFCPEMLNIARKNGLTDLVEGDANSLPFPDETFDLVTIAFGLRNMFPYQPVLREIHRVLKSNGHILILDFGIPQYILIQLLYKIYLNKILPYIGGIITGKKTAYQYLATSIHAFPPPQKIRTMLESIGFTSVQIQNMTLGSVFSCSAVK